MNGLSQRYRTLGELLAELKARLGFVAQGPASNNNNPVMISFLQEAHEYVYDQLNPTPMRKKTVITLEQGSSLYDWHNDEEDENIDPGLVKSLWIMDGSERFPLSQGIAEKCREDETRSMPVRYDTIDGQIELWPVPDRAYGLLVEYIASRPRFAQSSDRPGVSDRLVLLYALVNAKAHFRHPDAQSVAALFASQMRRERVKQHENRRYFLSGCYRSEKTVTGSGGDYRFTPE
ncbi:hypothetical protein [Oxalobacter paraformigenes]|uniref:Uncharacterized protein n=1 Tax=Oxalobacter paraformigenes TaxID=556268 RepID=C3X3K2_9BURK|nr:hypothetical protein [Oxalobacter paraformigenes]EEO27788.1 hypothetical protein OFAG_00941 [Oxalobacter paraformigenes]